MKKLFIFLLILSCNSNVSLKKFEFASAKNTSVKYYCTLQNTSNISVEANSKKVQNDKTVTVNYFYEMQVDSAGNKSIKITYDKFYVKIKNNDDVEEYSSEQADEASIMMDKVLKIIKGSIVIIEADVKGKITKITGADEITTKVINAIPNYQDGSNEVIKKQITEFVGQKFITENLVNNLQLMPDTAIAIGSTWKQKTDTINQIPISAEVQNTLVSVKNGVGTLISKAAINTNSLKSLSIMNMNINANLKGELNGDYEIVEKIGFVIKAKNILTLSGDIIVSNQEIPISLKITKDFKAEVIK